MHFRKKKKRDGSFVNNLNFGGERGKLMFQKKHELVLCLTSSFESCLQKSHVIIILLMLLFILIVTYFMYIYD